MKGNDAVYQLSPTHMEHDAYYRAACFVGVFLFPCPVPHTSGATIYGWVMYIERYLIGLAPPHDESYMLHTDKGCIDITSNCL